MGEKEGERPSRDFMFVPDAQCIVTSRGQNRAFSFRALLSPLIGQHKQRTLAAHS